jgi:hypothetical protein
MAAFIIGEVWLPDDKVIVPPALTPPLGGRLEGRVILTVRLGPLQTMVVPQLEAKAFVASV